MPDAQKSTLVKWRSLLLALAFTILAAIAAAPSPLDRMIEMGIGHLAWRPVSGDIVVVGVDDKTLEFVTSAHETIPLHTEIVKKIDSAGAQRLFVDFTYDGRVNDPHFAELAGAIRTMGDRAVLAVAINSYSGNDAVIDSWPPPAFGTAAQLACICWEYRYWQVWDIPLAVNSDGKTLPTFASILSRQINPQAQQVPIDYSYNTLSIPTYSALDLLQGRLDPSALSGKDVIFAAMNSSSYDRHYLPGHDLVPGAYIHIVAAETLKRGIPVQLHWSVALAAAAFIAIALIQKRKTKRFLFLSFSIAFALIATKLLLSYALMRLPIGPALLFLAITAFLVARVRHKQSAQHQNPVSGLPNFSAMRALPSFAGHCVIAAQIVNFDELVTYLPHESSTKLVEQIARRLELATTGSCLYHDSDGSFAWLAPDERAHSIDGQLAGLAALFNAPITIDDRRIDVKIAFGVNNEPGESNAQCLAAARGAAERAIRNRHFMEHYSSSQNEDAAWKLSFHSQLEDAMAAGDIWVAFQPQYHIKSGALTGLEALARWTHPERGIIPPDQFIVQAEETQDIYRLTLFVMDRAIKSAGELQSLGHDLSISVNLSAGLLDRSDLASTIRVMLQAHHLDASKLTIEITETAQFEDSSQALETLALLRNLGIQLSIDDYGTGQSNLEYLIRIEADEIKIDKRFVNTMRDSQRNFEIVKSTIELAHRLGAVAVAEGIEDQATLSLLEKLGCDVGQGYHLGKPQLFFEILTSLNESPSSQSA